MSRKHFQAIADSIRIDYKHATFEGRKAILDLTHGLCITFREVNPRFDRDKFLDACFDGLI